MLARDCRHITWFLEAQIKPNKDAWGLTFYPCAAMLKDGIWLPRVRVRSVRETARHYLRWLTPEHDRGEPYRSSMLGAWVTGGNRVSADRIVRVEKSQSALPAAIYEAFDRMGEVAMSSNQCIATMRDGTELPLMSEGVSAFYDFPPPFCGEDVVSVRRTRHDSPKSIRALWGFDTFVTWPDEEKPKSDKVP